MTRKLIIHDGRSERELVLVGTITVGRDPSCHINDLDPLLSRRHAHFVTTASGCTVTDLNSRNGMLVNGTKVREQFLTEGDLVQLGHLQLRYTEDHTVETPEHAAKSHATTAHDAATIAVVAATLEDTRPHPPHLHAAHDEFDATRSAGASNGASDDDEPTMAPRGTATSDLDATTAPTGKSTPAADHDATVAPTGNKPAAALDLDATFIAGVPRGNEPALQAMAPIPAADIDATFVAGDLDATFVTGTTPSLHDTVRRADDGARLTATADLRVTAASPGCRALFGVPPEALVGRPLGDVLAERLKAAAGDSPAELTFVVERSTTDRSLTVTLKAAQAVETVS